jgi:hypothetical protein
LRVQPSFGLVASPAIRSTAARAESRLACLVVMPRVLAFFPPAAFVICTA